MTIGHKLAISFAALATLMILTAIGSLQVIRGLGRSLTSTADTTARRLQVAAGLETTFYRMRLDALLAELSVINGALVRNQASGSACPDCHTPDKVEGHQRAFVELGRQARNQAASFRQFGGGGQMDPDRLVEGIGKWEHLYSRYLELLRAGNIAEAHQIVWNEIYPLVKDLDATTTSLKAAAEQELERSRSEVKPMVSASLYRAWGSTAISLVIAIGGFYLLFQVRRILTRSSSDLRDMASQAAAGSRQIAAASTTLAETSRNQCSSMEIVSASSCGIQSLSAENGAHMRTVFELAARVEAQFVDANRSLDQTVTAMQAVDASGEQISRIAKAIDEIAFQTNILALNAAIEAALAGAAGAGFGVVADEVRALAQRCASAAQETTLLIADSQLKSADGRQRLGALAATIHSISSSFRDLNSLVSQVSSGGEKQVESTEAMGQALVRMEQGTQEVAACAEENAAASEELSAQTEVLRQVAERLHAIVG